MALLVICTVFAFLFGICIGSFLNVVIYRLPRGMSLSKPPSSCPSCGYRIPFYLNIPLVSWLMLRGKCRNCGVKISPRYFVVEFVTGLIFLGLFLLYFKYGIRDFGFTSHDGVVNFVKGGWLIYLLHITLIAAFLAASAIDLELWVIPINLCWFVTLAGIVISSLSFKIIPFEQISQYDIFPSASARVCVLAFGSLVGLILSLVLAKLGVIKRSYEGLEEDIDWQKAPETENEYNDRLEVLKEIVFLMPVFVFGFLAYNLFANVSVINEFCSNLYAYPFVPTLMGSLWGYLVGCGVVWLTRIFGTLAFGREAMGLGDVHLMGAAGAVVGAMPVVVAFFLAPFFGLLWAIFQMFFKKTRQIPYGPFLSIAVFMVIIFHDAVLNYLSSVLLIKT